MPVALLASLITILVCYFTDHGFIGFRIVPLPIHVTLLAFHVIILIPTSSNHGFIDYDITPLPFHGSLHFRYPDSLYLN